MRFGARFFLCPSDGQEEAEEEELEPSPPSRIGQFVDEVYHKVGAANDLVVVKGEDGTLATSDFHVSDGTAASCLRAGLTYYCCTTATSSHLVA